jgi:hypothetical protein
MAMGVKLSLLKNCFYLSSATYRSFSLTGQQPCTNGRLSSSKF